MRKAAASLLTGIVLMLAAKRAAADEVMFSLSGDAGECGTNDAVRMAVEQRLRRSVFVGPEQADDRLVLTVEGETARIVETDREDIEIGRREVPIPRGDCPKTLDTIAVVLALVIGPPREKPAEVAPPSPPPPKPPRPKPKTPPPPPAEPAPHWQVSPVVDLAFGGGILPGVSWGIQAGAIVRFPLPVVSLIVRGGYWPAKGTNTSVMGEIDRLGGAVLGCADLYRMGRASVLGCIGADVGRLHATTADLTRASNSTLLLDVLAEARFGYRIGDGPVVLEPLFGLQIAGILRRDRFTYRDRNGDERTLLQPAPVAFQGSLGLAVHFL